jgi:putative transposase
VKFAAIADWADSDSYPVDFMCRQLGVSRSGFYAWRGRGPSERASTDAALIVVIKAAYQRLRGNPGVRRMHAELRTLGHRLSRKRVWRLMQAAHLQGRHPRAWKRTTVPGERPVPAPDLLGRDFTAERPDQRWCGDITYIKTWDGWAYLATVIDLHSRAVVGWAIADHMRTDLVTDALDMALTHRRPDPGVIFHSDRGTQYTSSSFATYCRDNNIRRSLGRTGICYDCRRRILLRRSQERDVLPAGLRHPSPSTVRRRRIHRSLLQPQAAALHPRIPHPVRGAHRLPRRGDRRGLIKPSTCPRSLTQPRRRGGPPVGSWREADPVQRRVPGRVGRLPAPARSPVLAGQAVAAAHPVPVERSPSAVRRAMLTAAASRLKSASTLFFPRTRARRPPCLRRMRCPSLRSTFGRVAR